MQPLGHARDRRRTIGLSSIAPSIPTSHHLGSAAQTKLSPLQHAAAAGARPWAARNALFTARCTSWTEAGGLSPQQGNGDLHRGDDANEGGEAPGFALRNEVSSGTDATARPQIIETLIQRQDLSQEQAEGALLVRDAPLSAAAPQHAALEHRASAANGTGLRGAQRALLCATQQASGGRQASCPPLPLPPCHASVPSPPLHPHPPNPPAPSDHA